MLPLAQSMNRAKLKLGLGKAAAAAAAAAVPLVVLKCVLTWIRLDCEISSVFVARGRARNFREPTQPFLYAGEHLAFAFADHEACRHAFNIKMGFSQEIVLDKQPSLWGEFVCAVCQGLPQSDPVRCSIVSRCRCLLLAPKPAPTSRKRRRCKQKRLTHEDLPILAVLAHTGDRKVRPHLLQELPRALAGRVREGWTPEDLSEVPRRHRGEREQHARQVSRPPSQRCQPAGP